MPRSRDLIGEDRRAFAYLLSQEALDELPRVYSEPPEDVGDGHEEQLDALRAEVARLSGLLDEAGERFESMRDRRNRARDHAVAAEQERDAARAEVVSLGRQLDEQRSLAAARAGTADNFRHLIGVHEPQQLAVAGPGLVTCDGHELRVTYDPAVADQATRDQTGAPRPRPDRRLLTGGHFPGDPIPLDGDPRRPHLDSWPDDAVLLRYRELRALVALHLDRYCEPGSGRAMREGDVPLRLSEVLDR